MEFHISRTLREQLDLNTALFSYTGNVVFGNVAASRRVAKQLNDLRQPGRRPGPGAAEAFNAGALFAMGLIDELSHAMIAAYRKEVDPAVLSDALRWFEAKAGPAGVERLLLAFTERFPNLKVYRGELSATEWLLRTTEGLPNREAALEELLLLWLANINTAFAPFRELFKDTDLQDQTAYKSVTSDFASYFTTRPLVSPEAGSLLDALCAPMLASPESLTGQLDFIREHWAKHLGEDLRRVLLAIDVLREEDLAIWMRFHPPSGGRPGHGQPGWQAHGFVGDEYVGFEGEFGDGEFIIGPDGIRRRRVYAADHQAPLNEYEAFSADHAWMPTVVMMAKSTYVWLEQLSKKYQRHIQRLDQIPDEELQLLASRGMTALWLIGLWERSTASRTIKRLRGQSDAVASAYSLKEYRIAEDLGGNAGYETLRDRAARFGVRLASDMVPNHMGIDSTWVVDHPEWFISRSECPFPVYGFEGPDLSTDSHVEIKIEDHYFDQTDAAVVFRLRNRRDGNPRYVYHGNDGTTFAWNDTAQLDYSKAEVREQVMQTILHVARLFPIIRFDAAMTLAKRHVQRLWFPLPGVGGSIPSRAESAMSQEQFDELMPTEFWRDVVDRVAVEVPGTLLLAEAFWLLEGYFVRTLGMHRVYNSAFMNMLRDEENAKYRSYLKKTIEFDPDILKRYVNFMSNPDERTAVDQFGSDDKFFGTSTLLATLPGLPMFAHGQLEGFTERYGMDFKQARLDENASDGLMARHQHEIAPLLKNRKLFAESTSFVLYDFWNDHGAVDENVFAYSNRHEGERAIVFYNNSYGSTRGTVHLSAAAMDKGSGDLVQRTVTEGLGLRMDESIIFSYRDAVRDLEYLRRSTDFQHHGLTLDLSGYGYVVLQNWQERWATADQPWDKLCDSLNGAGAHNLEEALWKLRFQPMHDALREALSASNIHALAEIARLLAGKNQQQQAVAGAGTGTASKNVAASTAQAPTAGGPSGELPRTTASKKVETTRQNLKKGRPASKSDDDIPVLPAKQAAPDSRLPDVAMDDPAMDDLAMDDSRLDVFLRATEVFHGRVLESLGGTSGQQHHEQKCKALSLAAIRLPSLMPGPWASWPVSGRDMLPGSEPASQPERVWGPLLAWIVLTSIPGEGDKTAMFDRFQFRHALAEIFSSMGFEGEESWRAAARVRALLSAEYVPSPAAIDSASESPALGLQVVPPSKEFWNDPDVRWLAGISEAYGVVYVNKERFEELISWFALPALLKIAQQKSSRSSLVREVESIASTVTKACRAVHDAGYNLDRYLASLLHGPEGTPQQIKGEQQGMNLAANSSPDVVRPNKRGKP